MDTYRDIPTSASPRFSEHLQGPENQALFSPESGNGSDALSDGVASNSSRASSPEYPAGHMDMDNENRRRRVRRQTSMYIRSMDTRRGTSEPTCGLCDQLLYGKTVSQHQDEGCKAVSIPPRTSGDLPEASFYEYRPRRLAGPPWVPAPNTPMAATSHQCSDSMIRSAPPSSPLGDCEPVPVSQMELLGDSSACGLTASPPAHYLSFSNAAPSDGRAGKPDYSSDAESNLRMLARLQRFSNRIWHRLRRGRRD